MKPPQVRIEGLDRLDLLSLQTRLEEHQIAYEQPTEETVEKTEGKFNEFISVSTSIIILAATKVALSALKLWLANRAKKDTTGKTITIEFPNNLVLTIEKKEEKNEDMAEKQVAMVIDILDTLESLLENFKA